MIFPASKERRSLSKAAVRVLGGWGWVPGVMAACLDAGLGYRVFVA
jgi:hypothetical protein